MKGAGLVLIGIVMVLGGFFAAEHRRRQSRLRHGFLALFEGIHFQIEHFSREQAELFRRLSVKALEVDFLPSLRKEIADDPVLALKRALEAYPLKGLFSPEETEGLLHYGEHFGLLSKKRQLTENEAVLALLRESVARDEKSLPTDLRLYRMLGVTAGLGFLIFMM